MHEISLFDSSWSSPFMSFFSPYFLQRVCLDIWSVMFSGLLASCCWLERYMICSILREFCHWIYVAASHSTIYIGASIIHHYRILLLTISDRSDDTPDCELSAGKYPKCYVPILPLSGPISNDVVDQEDHDRLFGMIPRLILKPNETLIYLYLDHRSCQST